MIGVKPLIRKTKQVYQIAFSYKGVECRELLDRPHTKANERYCENLRAEITRKIADDTFRYRDYFPDSKRANLFDRGSGSRTKLIKDLLTAYKARAEKTLEASTYAAYRKAIDNILIPRWGERRADQFTPADIREFVAEQTVTLKRIQNILLPLRNVFTELANDEVIPFNPFDKVKLAKLVPIEQRKTDYEPEPYTETEVKLLLTKLAPTERYAFQFWAYSGVRTGELVGLRWPSVDLEGGRVHVHETTTERKDKPRTKTDAGNRKPPLLPAAIEALELQRQFTLLSGDRVFQNPRSTRKDKAWDDKKLAHVWRAAHKGTGIAYRSPYQLRHTFASQLLSQGDNVAYIAKLLGHKTTEMVIRTYARWVEAGEALGFDRPPRQYGIQRLWSTETKCAAG